jgi:mono/diheme cytochrome c family protein
LYRYHCVHCHGLTGDGRGPTGPWVDPHPRDYRRGAFKFMSTDPAVSNRKPRRDDILRTLRQGVEGTSMPSFRLLPDKDLDDLVSYVIHLSMRGQVEAALISKSPVGEGSLTKKEECPQAAHDEFWQDPSSGSSLLQEWAASNDKVMTPAKDAYVENVSHKAREESIRHGYQIFSDPKGDASCIGCHTDYGRQVNFRYDDWGTLVRPRDLTAGVFRGGRRPIDLYWRIKGGIGPAGMPPTGLKNDKDIWDVVNFVESLPYPQMLPEDVRNKVYDRPPDEHPGSERAER